jgi:hypothetical protein
MGDLIRFGRRVPLPSSVQVLHDLLLMERNEKAAPPNSATPDKAMAEPALPTAAGTPRTPPEGQS